MQAGKVLELLAGHHVTRIGKRGHPLAVDQACIPADMIAMQVRAKNDVDVFGVHPQARQIGEVGARFQHVLPADLRPSRLVVAVAGIDEDVAVPRADQVAVKAQGKPSRPGIDETRPQRSGMPLDSTRLDVRIEGRGIEPHRVDFDDLVDSCLTEPQRLHLFPRLQDTAEPPNAVRE
jgi:hypothetical protein